MNAVAYFLMSDRLSTMARPVEELTQSRLIERCRERDPRAFEELYLEHRTSVYRVVARMITGEADREEIVQDVFVQVFRSIDSFKGTSKLSTWVHRIALNVVLQHIRRKKSRVKLQFREVLPESRPDGDDRHRGPEGALMADDRKNAVRRALDALSPKKRAALVLHDFEGMAAKEIGRIVGAPTLTVRTRLFYARKEFYSRLEQEPAFSDVDLSEGSKDSKT